MPRKPSCLCGECAKCRQRIAAKARYDAMTPEERRAMIARRDPEKVRASDRRRYYRDHAKRLAASARWREENPDRANASRRADAQRNPERRRVYKIVQRALRSGELVKPSACAECSDEVPARGLHAHHADYAKPLAVEWLCARCHAARHRDYVQEESST